MWTSWIGGGCIYIDAKIVAKNIIESKDHWRVTILKKIFELISEMDVVDRRRVYIYIYIYRCENRSGSYEWAQAKNTGTEGRCCVRARLKPKCQGD